MNTEILIECLYWFDAQMTGRKVVLVLDGFFAHECGLEMVKAK